MVGSPADRTTRIRIGLVAAVISVAAVAPHLPTLGNGFTNWDDRAYVLENPFIHELSWTSIKAVFSAYYMGNYHPLTMLSFMVEYRLFGPDPLGYHVVSLMLYLAITFLVFRLVLSLTQRPAAAIVAALLFGVHPLHVESVAWISERKDLLYATFYLGAALAYARYLRGPRRVRWYVSSLLLFLLGVLCKAVAVSLPLVLWLVDDLQKRRIDRWILVDKLPFLVPAAVVGVVGIAAQRAMGAVVDAASHDVLDRIVASGFGFVSYLVKLVVPVKLSAFYPYPWELEASIPPGYWVYPSLALLVVAGALLARSRDRRVFFGIFFYLATVALVLQWIPVGSAVMADRYALLPSVGIVFLAAVGGVEVADRFGTAARLPLILVLAAFAVWSGALTWTRCQVWRDSITLWTDVIDKQPASALAYVNRGSAWAELGEPLRALADFDHAVRLNPRDSDAFVNRGKTRAELGRHELAIEDFAIALELDPRDREAYGERGRAYMAIGDPENALADFGRAVDLDSTDAGGYVNRGAALGALGRFEEAAEDFRTATRIDPDDALARKNLGLAEIHLGNTREGCGQLRRAASLDPAVATEDLTRHCP